LISQKQDVSVKKGSAKIRETDDDLIEVVDLLSPIKNLKNLNYR